MASPSLECESTDRRNSLLEIHAIREPAQGFSGLEDKPPPGYAAQIELETQKEFTARITPIGDLEQVLALISLRTPFAE